MALARGQYERASRLLGAAGNARGKANMLSAAPPEIAELDGTIERLSQVMGGQERDKLLAKGRQTSLDDAVTIALGGEN